jgi:plasmid stabilization system protein ParE
MQVVWQRRAIDDLERLRMFLAAENPDAALRATMAIRDAGERLAEFPRIGRLVAAGLEWRDATVRFGKSGYIIRYRLDQDRLAILRIWHTREDHPAEDQP